MLSLAHLPESQNAPHRLHIWVCAAMVWLTLLESKRQVLVKNDGYDPQDFGGSNGRHQLPDHH